MSRGLPFLGRRRRSVLSRAVARWRAGNYDATLDALVDESGNGLHARLGSLVGADSNDPLRLSYVGKRLCFPGTANNYVSKPSAAADDFAGDTEYICQVYANWGTDSGHLRSRWSAGASYAYRYTANQVQAWFRVGGVDYFPIVNHGFSAGFAVKWIRIRRVSATGTVSFASSNDGMTYSAMGTDQATTAGALTSAAGTPVYIGCETTSTGLQTGSVMYDEARNGIGGTVVSSFNAAALSEPYATYTDPQGNIWTLNRSASGRKLCVVDRDLLLLGTDDYLEVADSPLLNFAAARDYTIALCYRDYATPDNFGRFLSKGNNGTIDGYSLRSNGTTAQIDHIVGDGVSTQDAYSAVYSLGVASVKVARRRGAVFNAGINATLGTSAADTIGDLSTTAVLRFGCSSDGAAFQHYEFMGAAFFREALSEPDLRRLAREMGVSA